MRITSDGHRFVAPSMRLDLHKSLLLSCLLLLLLFTPVVACAQTSVTINIHGIQINLPKSPFLTLPVTTEGIVVAVLPDGFYIENSDVTICTDTATLNCQDTQIATGEGIFVQVPPGVAAKVSLGDLVSVSGVVQYSNNSNNPGTEILLSGPPTQISQANPLPKTVSSDTLAQVATGEFTQWLEFEGMRISIPSLTTASGTSGTLIEATETITTNGQFWGVLTNPSGPTPRPFRATGISNLDTVPTTAPATVTRWNGNPQLFLIDSAIQGGPPLDVTANATIANLVGVVDFHVSATGYTGIVLDKTNGYGSVSGGSTEAAAAAPKSGVLTIATQDLSRFFGPPQITADAYARRLAKTALAITNDENLPDIIAIQSVGGLSVLTDLASKISATNYAPIWFKSNDAEGLGNGFLVKGSTVDVIVPEIAGTNETYTKSDGTTVPLFDTPPIVLHVGVIRVGTTVEYPLTIIVNNMLDRTDIDDPSKGPDVRGQREQQAEFIAHLIQDRQFSGEQVISVGNYNSFEFSDGYVDTIGAIAGTPVAEQFVTLPSPIITTPSLDNLTTTATPTSRYTYVESGSAEQPDHILVTADLLSRSSIDYARVNADFASKNLNDATTAIGNADHDPLVGYFVIPQFTSLTLVSSLNPSYLGDKVVFTATATSEAGGTPTGTVSFYDENGATLLGTASLDSTGVAQFSISTLPVGRHLIKASYSGDLGHEAATAYLTVPPGPYQVVLALTPTTTTLTCSPNPALFQTNVTCTATVSSANGTTPTGAVTFYDGTTALFTSTLINGIATFVTNSLSVGLHSITAIYARNDPYDTSTSSPFPERIWADFSISVNPTSGSIYTGEKANFTVTATPGPGFTFSVPLSCTNLPNESSCSFNPASIANGNGTSTWTVQTSAPSQTAARNNAPRFPWQVPETITLAGVVLFFIPKRFRRRGALLAIIAVLTLNTMFGCSSPRSLTGGTTPGTYTVTVTASVNESGFIVTHSANVTLTVKSLF